MASESSMVFIVDDDPLIRASIQGLLKSASLQSESFETAEQFLKRGRWDGPSCLILDITLPGMSGLDFQAQLQSAGLQIPIIFVTGHGDIPKTVKAMKLGASEFLTKPFNDQELLDAVEQALARDGIHRKEQSEISRLLARLDKLTRREREVLELMAEGLSNQGICRKLFLSPKTVETHVHSIFGKLGLPQEPDEHRRVLAVLAFLRA